MSTHRSPEDKNYATKYLGLYSMLTGHENRIHELCPDPWCTYKKMSLTGDNNNHYNPLFTVVMDMDCS